MQQFNTAKFCRDCGSAMVLAAVEGGERKQCTACGQIEWEPPVPVAAVLVPAGRNRDGIVWCSATCRPWASGASPLDFSPLERAQVRRPVVRPWKKPGLWSL